MKKRTKPFIRHICLEQTENIPDCIGEVLTESGLTVYEDPSGEGDLYFVSNRPLTWGWLRKNAKKYQIDEKWLARGFGDVPNSQELDELFP